MILAAKIRKKTDIPLRNFTTKSLFSTKIKKIIENYLFKKISQPSEPDCENE